MYMYMYVIVIIVYKWCTLFCAQAIRVVYFDTYLVAIWASYEPERAYVIHGQIRLWLRVYLHAFMEECCIYLASHHFSSFQTCIVCTY